MTKEKQSKLKLKLNKRLIIKSIITILLVVILLFLCYRVINRIFLKVNFESNIENLSTLNASTVFSIEKVALYSSASGVQKEETSSASWIMDISQYTDIAIYLNSPTSYSDETAIQALWIDSISFVSDITEESSNQSLNYKNIYEFGKVSDLTTLTNPFSISYKILSANQTIDYTKPQMYETYDNPITLEFVNKNIKENQTIQNTSDSLEFNGSLLKRANILLEEITPKMKFTIHILNNLNQEFICNYYLEVPLKDAEKSIYDGSYYTEIQNPGLFYRIS